MGREGRWDGWMNEGRNRRLEGIDAFKYEIYL